jgi:hypothetical protein
LLEQHTKATTPHITEFLDEELKRIETLIEKIRRALENSLDFNGSNNPLNKLQLLDPVSVHIEQINGKINSKDTLKEVSQEVAAIRKELTDFNVNQQKQKANRPNTTPVRKSIFRRMTDKIFSRKNG